MIVTSDGCFFAINSELAEGSKLIRDTLEDCDEGIVPLPNVNSKIIKNIIYFSKNGDLVSYEDVKEVMIAADYLSYDECVDHCARHIAQVVIKGKTADQIKEYFNRT